MLTVRGSDGANVRLRLVAALKDSIFQGEILISQVNFLRVFPDQEGYRFFLLNVPNADSSALAQLLKEALSDWGFQTESTRERLASFHKVENTYISTFQSLGSLGLILGTVGLAAVLLRNVMERRQELALLRAVGYRKSALSLIVLAENIVLMLWGLASGTACAFVAILPALHIRGTGFPVMAAGAVLTGVLAAGLLSSLVAVAAAFRSPLLTALRSE
jgi:ABC-type antimicrobial peptide transport system permease subunit